MRDGKKALRFSLRLTCEHFKQAEGCLAVLSPGSWQTKLVSVIPRRSEWNLDLLRGFLRKEKVTIPRNTIMAPVSHRRRLWAVLALKRQRDFDRHSARALSRIAR